MQAPFVNHIQQLSYCFHKFFGNDNMSIPDGILNSFECLLTELTGREPEELTGLARLHISRLM